MMNYWREVGGAAEQGVLNEIQISFSTKKAVFSATVRTGHRFFLSFSKKPERTRATYDLNHFYDH